eukprot:9915586-Lingulodinium_polyedra.AAC.1
MGAWSRDDPDTVVLQTVLRAAFLTPIPGWEELFGMPEEPLVILSSSARCLYDAGAQNVARQTVLVS